MFSFFKKDPPKQPPPSKNQQQQPPNNNNSNNNNQNPNLQKQQQTKHQDPLIGEQASSVFAPSMTNLNRPSTNNNNVVPPPPGTSATPNGVGPTGNPRLDRLQAAFGDIYAGEVTYFIPPVAGHNAATRVSQQQNQQNPPPRPIPNGFGELHSENGGHTYTGYFKDGTRDGQGHLVIGRYMIWGFWKENRIDINSSVRFDSLETLVKYRGFVRVVTDKSVRADPSKLSTFSIYVAQTSFIREGWGEAVYPDGRHVFGRWENDELCGFGTQITPNDGERYIGMFHNSKFHGFGVLFLPSGAICEGDWLNGTFKNTAGAITIPNRCVLTGQFTERAAFGKVSLTLLDAANHSREDVDTGLSFVTRAQYESLFFWATNPQILREEAIQLAVPILAMIENLEDDNPMTAVATVEKEIRLKLSKTRRFDNALRVAQRVIFFQYGSCGSPSHVRSGCGRATLGILTNHFVNNNNNNNSNNKDGSSKDNKNNKKDSSKTTTGNNNNNTTKPLLASDAIGWCETQKTGGCIHTGSGTPINSNTAKQLFDDMLSFSASCRKYWATLLQIGRQIREANQHKSSSSASHHEQNNSSEYYDDGDDQVVTETEVLNAVSRASFDAIYGACRKLTKNVFNHAFYYEQTAAEAALERLRDVTLNDVGINFARQSDDGLFDIYADATRTLEQSFASNVPTDILHGLHKWSQCIDSATRESQAVAGSADDLIPIHQFVLLRAKIPQLVPMTKLVSWLGEQPCFVEPTSAESFCLTTLQACVAMLHDLRANIRDTDGVLQSPSALEARVDDTLSLLEDQGVPFSLVRRAAEYCAGVLIQLLGKRQVLLSQMRNALEKYEMELEEEQERERQRKFLQEQATKNSTAATSVVEEENNNNTTNENENSNNNNKNINKNRKEKELVYLLPSESLFLMKKNTSTTNNTNNTHQTPVHGRPRGHSVTSAPVDRSLNEQMLHAISLLMESVGCNLVIAAVPITPSKEELAKLKKLKKVEEKERRKNNHNSDDDFGEEEEESESDDDSDSDSDSDDEQQNISIGKPNNMLLVSNVVVSSKKNNFGIKEAFLTKPTEIGTKWVFAARIPPGLLRSAPQLKIYATKLST